MPRKSVLSSLSDNNLGNKSQIEWNVQQLQQWTPTKKPLPKGSRNSKIA